MRRPPDDVRGADVLVAVRASWEPTAIRAEHLPLGFGAHHWRVSTAAGPALFATLDAIQPGRDLDDLAATYAAAAGLAATLPFVHAGLAPWAIPVRRPGGNESALSVTPWLDGVAPQSLDAQRSATVVAALHAAARPDGIRDWTPVVGPAFPADSAAATRASWDEGPYGEQARRAIANGLADIAGWTADYLRLAGTAVDARETWVPTHGEPGIHNQLLVGDRLVLVDWETLRLAPPERDTRTLGSGDPEMLAMFDLEWRLDEIAQYAAWFRAPHPGSEDDRIALAGLLEELSRP